MNCPNCGNEIKDNQKFCPNCGTNLINDKISFTEKIPLLSVVAGIFIVIVVVGCIATSSGHYNKPSDNTNTQNAVPQEMDEVDTNDKIETQEEAFDKEEVSYTAPKPKCVYETSNGVCFTTKAFIPPSLNYYDCTGGLTTYGVEEKPIQKYQNMGIKYCYGRYDRWAGAKKQCSEWGYKLPDAQELASLAVDIYDVSISNAVNVLSYLPDGHTRNDYPNEVLFPSGHKIHHGVWEDGDKDAGYAYHRYFGDVSTNRNSYFKYSHDLYAICVYDPKGRASSSYEKYEKQLQKTQQSQSQASQQNNTANKTMEELRKQQQAEQKRKEEQERYNNSPEGRYRNAQEDLF